MILHKKSYWPTIRQIALPSLSLKRLLYDRPRQLNELRKFDADEPVIVLCAQSVHLLRYADAKTWKWFRDYRYRVGQDK